MNQWLRSKDTNTERKSENASALSAVQRRTSTTSVHTVYECYRHSYRAISDENSKRIVDQSLERRPRFFLATIVGIAESLEPWNSKRICKSLRKAPNNGVKSGNGIESRHLILFN